MKLEWKMSLGHKNADRNEKMLRLGRNKKVLTDKVVVDKVQMDKVLVDKVLVDKVLMDKVQMKKSNV